MKLKEQQARLNRRRATGYAGRQRGETPPGSMNAHKPGAAGMGRRTKTKVAADSRAATGA